MADLNDQTPVADTSLEDIFLKGAVADFLKEKTAATLRFALSILRRLIWT